MGFSITFFIRCHLLQNDTGHNCIEANFGHLPRNRDRGLPVALRRRPAGGDGDLGRTGPPSAIEGAGAAHIIAVVKVSSRREVP